MKLTALEIKQQTFEKSMRGYDTGEVQAFLNLVANEWEHMFVKTRELEDQIMKLNDKLKHYERVEQALHETLQTAKDSAENKLAGAKKEAKNIMEKAEMEADAIVREAHQQRQQIRQSILRLLDRREEVIGGIRSYLEMAQESLQQFSKDEVNLFSLPKEDENDRGSSKTERLPVNKTKQETKKEDSIAASFIPGSESMDDILDEID